ncbi:hypothetical protein M0R04_16400, partial [Candidatus Dojkabacteria bacterium]|nr:hypothetical protein [Candidatus Dojkabacteria bacterium]
YTIKGLTIQNSAFNYSYAGLFGVLSGTVQDIHIIDGNINGWSSGSGQGATSGGIAGLQNSGSSIIDSSFSGNINAKWNSGGLVGESSGDILGSYSTGAITAGYTSSKANNSYLSAGGLVGVQRSSGKVSNSYSSTKVTLTGGYPSYIQKAGGLIGESFGKVSYSYSYDGNVYNTNGSATPTSPSMMKSASTYTGWNTSDWIIREGDYPRLPWEKIYGVSASGYLKITTCKELQSIENNPSGSYELASTVDCTESKTWNKGSGFRPIGTFSGELKGNGFTINNLYINRPTESYVGLIGTLSGKVSELGITNANITGSAFVGALAGKSQGTIEKSYSTGSVKGDIAEVQSKWQIGGLVGQQYSGTIDNSYSLANVVGYNAGGLVGAQYAGGIINNSYSAGTVSGNKIGGLGSSLSGKVNNSYYNSDTSTPTPAWNSWLLSTTYKNVGKMTVEMKEASTYEGWDFAKVWKISPSVNGGYPDVEKSVWKISMSAYPAVLHLLYLNSGTSTITWKIEGPMKNCKTIGPTGSDWVSLTLSPLEGIYNKELEFSTIVGDKVYSIECITEDGSVLKNSTTVSVVHD